MNNERKYKIIIFASSCLPIDADSLSKRPLASLETELIELSEGLAKRGHSVVVYTSNENNTTSINNVQYVFYKDFYKQDNTCDVFIAVRKLKNLFINVKCKARFYFTQDAFNSLDTFGIGDKRYLDVMTLFLGKSKWHTHSICGASGFPLGRSVALGDSVNLENFSKIQQRNRKRLIFTSAPFKGLNLVYEILKRIQEKDPQVEFHSFSGLNIYDDSNPYDGQLKNEYEKIVKKLEELPNVFIHGNILQEDLAKEYMKSSILFYPSVWPTTGAKVAMEAQAAGTPIITTSMGALPEIVGDAGMIVNEEIGTDEFYDNFANATLTLLEDDDLWSKLSLNGKMRAQKFFSNENIVTRFENILKKLNI